MKNPNPAKLREVAAKFREIYYNEKTIVDFDMSYVKPTPCGTVACHGGWALVALSGIKNSIRKEYSRGISRLSNFVMGDPLLDLAVWADSNDELWGNENGLYMFNSNGYIAFNSTRYECTLLTIADHYDAVAKRIEELA